MYRFVIKRGSFINVLFKKNFQSNLSTKNPPNILVNLPAKFKHINQ